MPSWNDRPYFTSDGDDRPDGLEYHECGQARLTVAGEQASLLPLPDALIPSTPDPDAIETPAPYTAAEWNTTEGARRCYCPGDCNCRFPERFNYCGCKQHDTADHLTHSERVQEAGYELGDPKGWSVP